MIKSKEEYYSILERLRALNFNQKLGRNLQAKLEAFEKMEDIVNLTMPVVTQQRELLAFIEEVSEFDALVSSTRLRLRAKELLKDNCG